MILHEPVERWPLCDCLVSFASDRFPLEKAVAYVELRRPYLINDVVSQYTLLDRRKVYAMLSDSGIRIPNHIVVSRDGFGGKNADAFLEADEYVEMDGVRIYKVLK